MEYLQGIIMKLFSNKTLIHLFIVTCFAFTSHFTFAEAKISYEASAEQQVIHLNKSTAEQLMTLKGIGKKKAQAIILYREKMGDFKSIEDLVKVKGIGEKLLIDNKSKLKI